jgi:hypothetical protein
MERLGMIYELELRVAGKRDGWVFVAQYYRYNTPNTRMKNMI